MKKIKIGLATIKDFEDPNVEFIWDHGIVVDVPIKQVVCNSWNYNEMSAEEFNLLGENINEVGFLEPILIVPIIPKKEGKPYEFRIVNGEHRYEAQRLEDAKTVRATIADPNRFNEKEQMRQTARMNQIHGKPNKVKFKGFVEALITKHGISFDELSHELGFVDQDEFGALMDNARQALPPEAKKEFDEVKDTIKTVDDLTNLLNRLFINYGNTLPANFMILDFGGKDLIWVRMAHREYKRIVSIARQCIENGVTFDSVIMRLLEGTKFDEFIEINKDNLDEVKEKKIESLDEITEVFDD